MPDQLLNSDYKRVSLPPLLQEFIKALEDEIEAARQNESNNAVPLSNGKKIGYSGGSHHYVFMIDSIINAPSDSPAELKIPGMASIPVNINHVEGLKVTLSSEKDIGEFIPYAALTTNLTMLMKKLIKRLEENAHITNPAADRMLSLSAYVGESLPIKTESPLYKNQKLAIESALGRNITYIQGPPGTGKTHTIGALVKELFNRDRTVLIVSHTNIAIDQAISKVAANLEKELINGSIVRIGDVSDPELVKNYELVMLNKQVEIQSEEYTKQRNQLLFEKENEESAKWKLLQIIKAIAWIEKAEKSLLKMDDIFNDMIYLFLDQEMAEKEFYEMQSYYSQVQQKHLLAKKGTEIAKKKAEIDVEKQGLEAELAKKKAKLDLKRKDVESTKANLVILERIEPLREMFATFPPVINQKNAVLNLYSQVESFQTQVDKKRVDLGEEQSVLEIIKQSNSFARVMKRMPNLNEQEEKVSALKGELRDYMVNIDSFKDAYEKAKSNYSIILQVEAELSNYEHVGTRAQELKKLRILENGCQASIEAITKTENALRKLIKKHVVLESKHDSLRAAIHGEPSIMVSETKLFIEKYEFLRKNIIDLKKKIDSENKKILIIIDQRFYELCSIGIDEIAIEEHDEQLPTGDRIEQLRTLYNSIKLVYQKYDREVLKEGLKIIKKKITDIEKTIEAKDVILSEIKKTIILKAKVIGATLTKCYLSDDIHSRKFDTVILDEASMAPVPALWAAALLAENNLVIIGDPKQLPPIVISKSDMAKKWLGRDIFEVSGYSEAWDASNRPENFFGLTVQRRMNQSIMNVGNLFYGDGLTMAEDFIEDNEFTKWYKKPKFDNEVILLDTSSLNAWVTSVNRGRKTSRLNLLSAVTAVNLAEQLIDTEINIKAYSGKKILIIAPYNPHAKLVNVLIRENEKLADIVTAGTVHSFQGSEADVVIFDLVVDEPHFRTNLFHPGIDKEMKALLNVGLSRAKSRLIVMGDFTYCIAKGGKAFLGRVLLPHFMKCHSVIDAKSVVPNDLVTKAAEVQIGLLGGGIEPKHKRSLMTQSVFYQVLIKDIEKAQKEIIIYSPFLTTNRVTNLLPQITAAIKRGIQIYVITKAPSDRKKAESDAYEEVIAMLNNVGVNIIYKKGAHEKVIFVDDDVIWSGSLNPLSYSNTQEVMERRVSKTVFGQFRTILRVDDLLAAFQNDEDKCPICDGPIIAAEGNTDPFYFRCINDECYTRGIGKPYARDGLLTCGSKDCNASLKFGYWGDKPHWRCTENSQHRLKVFKSHLKLPKMAALIPIDEISKVSDCLGLSAADLLITILNAKLSG